MSWRRRILFWRRKPDLVVRAADASVDEEFEYIDGLGDMPMSQFDHDHGVSGFNQRGGRAGYVIKPQRRKSSGALAHR